MPDYNNDSLNTIIFRCDDHIIQHPAHDAREGINMQLAMLGHIRASLKKQYKDEGKCSDLTNIKNLIIKLKDLKSRYEFELDDISAQKNIGLESELIDVYLELIEIAVRNGMFEKINIPSSEAPAIE